MYYSRFLRALFKTTCQLQMLRNTEIEKPICS